MDLSRLKQLYTDGSQERDLFRQQMKDIYELCIPGKNTWLTSNKVVAGSRTDLRVFNSKPITSVKKFSAKLVSLVAPNGTQFFEIGCKSELDEAQEQEFKKTAAEVASKVLKHLNNSNFYQALNESFVDLSAGMGGLLVNRDKDEEVLYFKALDMSRVCVLEDNRGILNYIFREIGTMKKEDLLRLYPEISFGEITTIDLVESVIKEDGKYVYRLTDRDFKHVYKESESKSNPFIIFRWDRRPGENRGRGLLNDLLGTLKMTNTMAMDIIDASAKIVNPPYLTNSASKLNANNIKIMPNALITLASADSFFKPLEYTGNLPFAMQEVRLSNEDIDDALMINILGQVGQGKLTATEVSERMQLAAEILGQFYSRIQRELLNPLFSRVIDLLMEHFIIEAFNQVKDDSGTVVREHQLSYKYQSPIINMQKQIQCQKLMQAMQFAATVTGQQAQQYLNAAFKMDEIAYYAAESLGADLTMVNTVEETKSNLQKMAQQQQQAMQQQQQQQAYQMELMKQQGNSALSRPVNTLQGVTNG